MQEIWKPIKDYEGLYEVSSFGRVMSVPRLIKRPNNYDMFLKGKLKVNNIQATRKGNYRRMRVTLNKDSINKTHKVHRLVAKAFIPNPDNKPQVNHKDFNPLNNTVDNLEWMTNTENYQYSLNAGRGGKMNAGINNGMHKKKLNKETKKR